MNLFQNMPKLFYIISALFLSQVFYSQIPKEATYPLEVAEAYGLKICDSYMLSYFTSNDTIDGMGSYNHGMIRQEIDRKGKKDKNALNHYFDVFEEYDDQLKYEVQGYKDIFSQIDSVSSRRKGEKYNIQVSKKSSEIFTGLYRNEDVSNIDETDSILTVAVTEQKDGTIIKRWNSNGNDFENIITFNNREETSKTLTNLTDKTRRSLIYKYDEQGRITSVEELYWSNIDSLPQVIKSNDYSGWLIGENTVKRKFGISGSFMQVLKDKQVVITVRLGGDYPNKKNLRIEYILDNNGFILSYKQYYVYNKVVNISPKGKSESVSYDINSIFRLQSSGLIFCN